MLGQTIALHGGPDLLELVEQVRKESRVAIASGDDAAISALLTGLDSGTAVWLARAFSQFFQLANIAEQRHRAAELAGRAPLHGIVQRLASADPDEVNAVLARLELRPVFTAHPTEASRQTVLAILRRVAVALDEGVDDDRLGAYVDQLWQTDELRPDKPTVADEARAVGWYMEQLGRGAVPTCWASSTARCAPPGSRSPRTPARSSWAAGWAATATGNPNVTPAVTREVLELYTDRALRIHESLLEQLLSELSISTRVVGVSRSCARRWRTTGGCCPTSTPSATGSTPTSPTGSSSPSSRPASPTPAPASPRARGMSPASTTSARTATSPTSP
jgi:phosphoenolpyruvate carboxylase